MSCSTLNDALSLINIENYKLLQNKKNGKKLQKNILTSKCGAHHPLAGRNIQQTNM